MGVVVFDGNPWARQNPVSIGVFIDERADDRPVRVTMRQFRSVLINPTGELPVPRNGFEANTVLNEQDGFDLTDVDGSTASSARCTSRQLSASTISASSPPTRRCWPPRGHCQDSF